MVPLNAPLFNCILCSGTKLGKNASELLKMISGDRCRSNDLPEGKKKPSKSTLEIKIHCR